jgi:hypothetical protein
MNEPRLSNGCTFPAEAIRLSHPGNDPGTRGGLIPQRLRDWRSCRRHLDLLDPKFTEIYCDGHAISDDFLGSWLWGHTVHCMANISAMKMENGFKRERNAGKTPLFVDTWLPQTRGLRIVQKVNQTRLFSRRNLVSVEGVKNMGCVLGI